MKDNKRILIIDDDESIRETYRSILLPEVEPDSLSMGRALFDIPLEDVDSFTDTPLSTGEPSHKKDFSQTADFDAEGLDGYELTLAGQGEHGVALVETALQEKTPFAVAFIDMKMPGLNGAETAGKIWAIDSRLKIVIVTAYSEFSPEDIIAVTGRGDLFYLRKPFNHEEILQFARALTNTWNLEQKMIVLQNELEQANLGLAKKVQKQATMIVQAEKMASIGILAAGVAHEINNPLAYVRSNLSIGKTSFTQIVARLEKYGALERYLASSSSSDSDQTIQQLLQELAADKNESGINFILDDLDDLFDESLDGVDRIRDIVRDLKTFSRVDESEYKSFNLNDALDSTLKILKGEIKHKTTVTKNYGNIPRIQCYPQKISQVLMNLLLNAAQAIEDNGTIELTTRSIQAGRRDSDRFVEIIVSDTGCGIPEGNLKKMFDPFFTTKPVGTGTGLGLSIVYEIIKSHGGSIEVNSDEGQGSQFSILFPEKKSEKGVDYGDR